MTAFDPERPRALASQVALRREPFGALAYHFGTRRCLTWEVTYACNLACVHCLSSSGRRDPRELSTAECLGVVDELRQMQVFYVNIGGGEPTVRRGFWEVVDYATAFVDSMQPRRARER